MNLYPLIAFPCVSRFPVFAFRQPFSTRLSRYHRGTIKRRFAISIFHASPKLTRTSFGWRNSRATHPNNVEEEVAGTGTASARTAETEEESLVSVLVFVRLDLVQRCQLLGRVVARLLIRELHSHLVVLRLRSDLVHSILRFWVHVLQTGVFSERWDQARDRKRGGERERERTNDNRDDNEVNNNHGKKTYVTACDIMIYQGKLINRVIAIFYYARCTQTLESA